jgi:hypothetical protein
MSDNDANPSEQIKDGFNRFWQLFKCFERTLNIFVLLIVPFYGRNTKADQALNEN